MKKIILSVFFLALSSIIYSQIPYFAGTVGKNKLYGYTSLKLRPGVNSQETYTTFQYGIGKSMATGLDLYTGFNTAYTGLLLRYGTQISPYFNIGGQITPSFNLNDNMSLDYSTVALYMNGNLTKNGNLFWCSNTWWAINKAATDTYYQWLYLGYSISLKNNHIITPMVGEIHSWKFDEDTDISVGFYYTIKRWNFYVWGNDFLKDYPRIVIGIDFTI